MSDTIFLTDGQTFLGPYVVGAFDIHRGTRTLREVHGAAEVHVVRADTLATAKSTWQRSRR